MSARVVATMLVGPGTEGLVREAIKHSWHLFDHLVVIDTRPPDSGELLTGGRVCGGHFMHPGGVAVVVEWPWTGHYDDARNAALGFARAEGADYALTVDTDENLSGIDGPLLRLALRQAPDADVWLVSDNTGKYTKERIIALDRGRNPRWVGYTHEAVVSLNAEGDPIGTNKCILPGSFSELPKTREENLAKCKRDVVLLSEYIQSPDRFGGVGRWYSYIGECLFSSEEWSEAGKAFGACANDPKTHGEQRAWALVRAAECHVVLNEFESAVECAAYALAIHSGFAREAGWIAAYACGRLGRVECQLHWALISHRNPPPGNRQGFRNPNAERGCLELAANAYLAMGRVDEASEFKAQADKLAPRDPSSGEALAAAAAETGPEQPGPESTPAT